MSPRVTAAVVVRVLTQLRRDHRTLAMLLVLPCLLISLLWWMFDDTDTAIFDRVGPALLAMFPFIVMFLVTSVTTLRERSSGTLERLLSMPLGKLDFLVGYALAFGAVAAVQSVLAVGVAVGLLGGMPMCHGSGGLTAHYRAGARSWRMGLWIGLPLLAGGLAFAVPFVARRARRPPLAANIS